MKEYAAKEIEVKVTILVSEHGTSIEIHDEKSAITFVKVNMSAEQFCKALGRCGYCDVESAEVNGLDRVGKQMIVKDFTFEIPDVEYSERSNTVIAIGKTSVPDGWEMDEYFGSQNSFFRKENKMFAHTHIRKWE